MFQKYVRRAPRDLVEIAEKPAGQVDQVHALVDQFAAARKCRYRRAIRARSRGARRVRNGRG